MTVKYDIKNYPDEKGCFGQYGGCFLSSKMEREFKKLDDFYQRIRNDAEFINDLKYTRKHYQGRPTPITFARNLTKKCGGASIYLKREDLNHTGAHKLNHCVAYALVAKKIGKNKIIADTGAGQHGVAMAAAAAYFNMKCEIHMGEVDAKKEAPNVDRMRLMGTKVIIVKSGGGRFIDATNSSFAAYEKDLENSFYPIGSTIGPRPIPQMVRDFQSIIGQEALEQFLEITGGKTPNKVVAVVGGGSNAMGLFSGFVNNDDVELYAAKAQGCLESAKKNVENKHKKTVAFNKKVVMSEFTNVALVDENEDPTPVYSVASGLDYPYIGPEQVFLNEMGRVQFKGVSDEEAISAFYELSELEGIIPALESAHAVALAMKIAPNYPSQTILVNLSGRGDKDMDYVLSNFNRLKN
ncbi:MAG: tryptophan synthase subunit beta [Oscillospiraceae bacterium]|jgi:tryptophan synthase beta subunit|nr:tryptophan synthase subunit beta [Oscillospiraceae bacterium]